jgi:hypothetical protein
MCQHFDVMGIFFLHSGIWGWNLGSKQGQWHNAMPMRYSTMRETREETGPRVTWRSVRSRAPTGRTCASMQRQASSFRPGQPHAHGHRAHLRPDRWRKLGPAALPIYSTGRRTLPTEPVHTCAWQVYNGVLVVVALPLRCVPDGRPTIQYV